MQRHRIFIAISLPDKIKKKLAEKQKEIDELFSSVDSFEENRSKFPGRWTKDENFHITLEFIGSVGNDELLGIIQSLKKIARKHNPFLVKLKKISYGPIKKNPPRMIWVVGEKSKEFAFLRDDIEDVLSFVPSDNFKENKNKNKEREFSPHITLARIKQWEWRRIDPEEIPEINEDIDLSFVADSIEVMESKLKRSGAEYIVLESILLSNE